MYTQVTLLQKKKQQGFTLIEVLVAMSIFVMVVGMAVGTVIVMIDANAKSQHMAQAATNLSFALDSMTREIRTGTYYFGTNGNPTQSGTAVRDCAQCSAFSFVEAGQSLTSSCGGGRVAYRHANNAIQRRICGNGWEDLTAPDVVVDRFTFTVKNTDRTDNYSPTVTMFIGAHVDGVDTTGATLQMQSSVTQQALDI